MEYSIRIDNRGFQWLEDIKLIDRSFYKFPIRSIKGLIILKNTPNSLTYYNRDADSVSTIYFETGLESEVLLDI